MFATRPVARVHAQATTRCFSTKAFFPGVSKVQYEGPKSKNPLAFKWYNPEEVVEGKTMKEHLRFSVVYWHTMRYGGSDPFGSPTIHRLWEDGSNTVENAQRRVRAYFELLEKLQVPFFAFHDRDVAPEANTLSETNKNLDAVVTTIESEMKRTGIKLLWGTANLFSHPRYMHGAGTSPYFDVFCHAGAQVKKALEVTQRLGGAGYVFWGGREGYQTLLNTDMKRELDNMAKLLQMAVDYKKQLKFNAQFYIEPKPMEPTKHQYDSDSAATLNFLRAYNLKDDFKLNIETNHATLAGHDMVHELEVAGAVGALGSIDANCGDPNLGWDLDRFDTSLYSTSGIMYTILKYGGFTTGGVNFDARVRRESHEDVDLFHAHVGGMDAFARGLKIAAAMRKDGRLAEFVKQRYSSWDAAGLPKQVAAGKASLADLEAHVMKNGGSVPVPPSGRQEMLENMLNEFL